MKALVTCYPPLSQVTQTVDRKVDFFILLDVDKRKYSAPWQVSVHYSSNEGWKDSLLELSPKSPLLYHFDHPRLENSQLRLCFAGIIEIITVTNFTVKFRAGPDKPWKWVKDHQGVLDGTIQLKPDAKSSIGIEFLNKLVGNLNTDLKIKKVLSQCPNTTLWSISTTIEPAEGDESKFSDVRLGQPWFGDIVRWFALIRRNITWLEPRQGKSKFLLDKEAVLCSFLERVGGRHLVWLAISGVDDVTTLMHSDSEGNVILKIRNDSDKPRLARLLIALGEDFESANAAAMYHARIVVHGDETTGKVENQLQTKDEITPKWYENWFDGLAYCTWNGLGEHLTDAKLLEAVDTLAANNIKISTLIIDDNWQSIEDAGTLPDHRAWAEFEADRDTFPKGLKYVASTIRQKHPHVQHIVVWHALWGYWGGISTQGKIFKSYKTIQAPCNGYGPRGTVTIIDKEDVMKMFDDFYDFLSGCGIDGVKTDAQCLFDTMESAKDRRELISTYLDAWSISSLKHFATKAIACMAQTPHIIFHSMVPQNKPAILMRNSEDFFPNDPASHAWHIFTNACNNLLTQHLNVIPDWDMFQTVHDYSGFHAAARCVNGGPIYITDIPGQHNIELIREMTATTTRGKTVILRPSCLGKNLNPYISNEDPALLKIGTYNGSFSTGNPIIGIFNVSTSPLSELIPLSTFSGIHSSKHYVIRFHTTGLITDPANPSSSPAPFIAITIPPRGYEICTAYPLRSFSLSHDPSPASKTLVATLGLLGKMTGAAAVVDQGIAIGNTGKITISTTLKALGVLGIFISHLPSLDVHSSLLVSIHSQVVPVHTVRKANGDERVLEIDVEAAWEEMGLVPGWGNEVEVKVFVNSV